MATDPFELYIVISPIAAAFAGFGSLASGLGQRRGGDDARVDAMCLALMLSAFRAVIWPSSAAGECCPGSGASW